MPRPRKVDRPTRCETVVPQSIHAKVQLELWSEVEGKVPFGAWSELVTKLLTEWLEERGVQV